MGLFDKLFRKNYPSSDWIRPPSVLVEFNFDRSALCGVSLGGHIDELSRLGPAEDPRAARQGLFRYFSLGVEFKADQGKLRDVTLIWADTLGDSYRPFSGACTQRGRAHFLTPGTTEAEVTRIFGQPTAREEVRDKESGVLEEVVLSYSSPDATWDITFGERGTLQEIRASIGGVA